jgi:hypothetical protein
MPTDYKSYFQSKEPERWLIAVPIDPYDNNNTKNDTGRKETV